MRLQQATLTPDDPNPFSTFWEKLAPYSYPRTENKYALGTTPQAVNVLVISQSLLDILVLKQQRVGAACKRVVKAVDA